MVFKTIDIGEFTFTDYKKISRNLVKFTNKDDSNIILLKNIGAKAIILYHSVDTNYVNVSMWVSGNSAYLNLSFYVSNNTEKIIINNKKNKTTNKYR